MAVPHFVIDAPGGGGKIPLLPGDYVVHMDEDGAILRNYEHKTFHYPQPKNGSSRQLPMVGAGRPCNGSPNGCDGGLDDL
jgi:lysine 2,3-aminomutase